MRWACRVGKRYGSGIECGEEEEDENEDEEEEERKRRRAKREETRMIERRALGSLTERAVGVERNEGGDNGGGDGLEFCIAALGL